MRVSGINPGSKHLSLPAEFVIHNESAAPCSFTVKNLHALLNLVFAEEPAFSACFTRFSDSERAISYSL